MSPRLEVFGVFLREGDAVREARRSDRIEIPEHKGNYACESAVALAESRLEWREEKGT